MDQIKPSASTSIPRRVRPVVQELNRSIITRLRSSATGSNLVRGKILISLSQQQFLQEHHEVDGRFRRCDDFLQQYGIVSQRFYNSINSCQIKAGTFQLKVKNGTNIRCFSGTDLGPETLSTRPRLFFLFEREDIIKQRAVCLIPTA